MKRLLYIIIIVLIGFQQLKAQSTEELKFFKEKILPQLSNYFVEPELTQSGQLKLIASEQYALLSLREKEAILDRIIIEWNKSLILVFCGLKRELWGYDNHTKKALFLDTWDISIPKIQNAVMKNETEKTNLHPWFVYFGGMTNVDSNNNISLMVNSRIGFFLLLNRWDMAITSSGYLIGNASADPTASSNLGIMSKFYFPINRLHLSPSVGGDISLSSMGVISDTVTHNLNMSFVLGVSWYVGIGSLDIDFKIGKELITMVGYTISLNSKTK